MHTLHLALIILYELLVVAAICHVVMDNRQPAKTMAWVLVIYFVPVVGLLFYVFLGINTRKERLPPRPLCRRHSFLSKQQDPASASLPHAGADTCRKSPPCQQN